MSPAPTDIAEQQAARLPAEHRRTFDAFRRLGMSAPAALEATRGRDEPALPSTRGETGSRPIAPHEQAREAVDGDMTGRSQAIAARRDAREAAQRDEQRATSDGWHSDRTERAAQHVAEINEARQAQETRLGLRPATGTTSADQLRASAASKRERLVTVSEQRYLREGCTAEQARRKAEQLWPDTTVLLEEAHRLSEQARHRLRELLTEPRRLPRLTADVLSPDSAILGGQLDSPGVQPRGLAVRDCAPRGTSTASRAR